MECLDEASASLAMTGNVALDITTTSVDYHLSFEPPMRST
jgi:hypothetical protein